MPNTEVMEESGSETGSQEPLSQGVWEGRTVARVVSSMESLGTPLSPAGVPSICSATDLLMFTEAEPFGE